MVKLYCFSHKICLEGYHMSYALELQEQGFTWFSIPFESYCRLQKAIQILKDFLDVKSLQRIQKCRINKTKHWENCRSVQATIAAIPSVGNYQ